MHKKGEWTVKSSSIAYKTPWITVNEDKVIRPDGKDGIFTTIDILPGVTIFPLDKDGTIYCSKQFQYALNDTMILPGFGGGIEKGEDILEAAKRELREEAGLIAKNYTSLGYIHSTNSSIIDAPNYMFLAESLEQGEAEWDGGEEIEIFKVLLKTAVEWVMNGTITHATAQTIILKAAKIIEERS